MSRILKTLTVSISLVFTIQAVSADDIVTSGHAKITTEDVNAELLRVNPDERAHARSDARSVSQLLDALHTYFGLAKIATAEGFDKDPLVKRSMEIAALKQMVAIYLNSKGYDQIKEMGDLTPAAREMYTLRRADYAQPATLEASHVLINFEGRSEEAARALASDLVTKARAGSDFSELATKHSDDPGSKARGGKLSKATKKDLVEPFWNAAVALKKPGDISEPVKSQFGYHIIRLDAFTGETITPFDLVKDQIINELKATRAEKLRTDLIAKISNDPSIKIDDEAFEKYTGATRITPKK